MALKPFACAVGAAALAGTLVAGASSANAACRGPVRSDQLSGMRQTITEIRARANWRKRCAPSTATASPTGATPATRTWRATRPSPAAWYCRAIASPCDRPPR